MSRSLPSGKKVGFGASDGIPQPSRSSRGREFDRWPANCLKIPPSVHVSRTALSASVSSDSQTRWRGPRPRILMTWRDLNEYRDDSVPKLGNLRRAREAGLVVPEPTLWA